MRLFQNIALIFNTRFQLTRDNFGSFTFLALSMACELVGATLLSLKEDRNAMNCKFINSSE